MARQRPQDKPKAHRPSPVKPHNSRKAEAATTAAPFPYCSWGAVDQIARIKAGKETWDSSALPIALVTKDNADKFTGAFFSPPDFDYKAMFAKLWGKS